MTQADDRVHVGDTVIVEDAPTGVAHHAEGVVTAFRSDGFLTVEIDGQDFLIWHDDVSVKES